MEVVKRTLGTYKTFMSEELKQLFPLVSSLGSFDEVFQSKEIFLSDGNLPVYVLVSSAVVSDQEFATKLALAPGSVSGRIDNHSLEFIKSTHDVIPEKELSAHLNLTREFLTDLYYDIFSSTHTKIDPVEINTDSLFSDVENPYMLHDVIHELGDFKSVDSFVYLSELSVRRKGLSNTLLVSFHTYLFPIVFKMEDGSCIDVTKPQQ